MLKHAVYSSDLKRLQNYLKTLPDGPVLENIDLVNLLYASWDDFIGISPIDSWLHQIENINWHSPVLSFDLDRQIGSQDGSIRSVHERWTINIDTQIADSRLLSDEELEQIQIDNEFEQAIPEYIRKRRRYYKLLDKKYKLMAEHEYLLEGTLEDIGQYCRIDAEIEAQLNLQKTRNVFHEAEVKLIELGGCVNQYVSGNEFMKAVVIDNILKG